MSRRHAEIIWVPWPRLPPLLPLPRLPLLLLLPERCPPRSFTSVTSVQWEASLTMQSWSV